MKHVGEIFTVEREVNFSAGGNCFLSHLDGGVVLLSEDVVPLHPGRVGAAELKVFTFKCVTAGPAAFQLAFQKTPFGELVFEEVLPFEISDEPVAGGWSAAIAVSENPDALSVFTEAMDGLVGVNYTPLTVRTQVVNGVNYRFVCKAVFSTAGLPERVAMVCLYKKPGDRAILTGIEMEGADNIGMDVPCAVDSPSVSKVTCVNAAGFVQEFCVVWKKGDEGGTSDLSQRYTNPNSWTIDLDKYSIPEGAEVWVKVHAIWGKTKEADDHAIYKRGCGNSAVYRTKGATLTYSIVLEG